MGKGRCSPVIGLMQCTSSFVVAYRGHRALRGRVGPLITSFVTREKLSLSRRGAMVAGMHSNFSFLKFGVHGCNGRVLAGPAVGTRGHFVRGVHGMVGNGGNYGRRSLVEVLGTGVQN